MLPLVLAALILAVFAACFWSGGTLATHHADPQEVRAVLVIGATLLAAVALLARTPLADVLWPVALVAAAGAVGLFAGYLRAE